MHVKTLDLMPDGALIADNRIVLQGDVTMKASMLDSHDLHSLNICQDPGEVADYCAWSSRYFQQPPGQTSQGTYEAPRSWFSATPEYSMEELRQKVHELTTAHQLINARKQALTAALKEAVKETLKEAFKMMIYKML